MTHANPALDDKTRTELEAAAFRRLLEHLRARADVQNIDLMNLAGFCRNCLSNWYQDAAKERGLELTKEGAREVIYGMPYKDWQAKHQKEASAEQTRHAPHVANEIIAHATTPVPSGRDACQGEGRGFTSVQRGWAATDCGFLNLPSSIGTFSSTFWMRTVTLTASSVRGVAGDSWITKGTLTPWPASR